MRIKHVVIRMCPRLIILQLLGFGMVAAMSDVWVELQAPRFIVHRHSATLRCEHNVNSDYLYKVVFFKDGHRVMQYVSGRDPPFELYNFTGADIKTERGVAEASQCTHSFLTVATKPVNLRGHSRGITLLRQLIHHPECVVILNTEVTLSKLSATSITLESMDFPASGSYACEIALDTPLYSKISKQHDITVIVRQKFRPKIKIKHRKLTSSETLEATCQSAPAHPAPHLTWFVNNVKVDESLTTPNGVTSHRHHHGISLSATNISLHFPLMSLQLVPNQTVEISCISTIPSYAAEADGFIDIQNHTIPVNVIRQEPTPTQMPVKIIGAHFNSSSGCNKRSSIISILLFVFIYFQILK